jgi:hypothetical protein
MNTPDAPDPRKVAEAALEAFVYVPIGLALEARDLVPKLAQRGRNQVVLARLGARFAMQRAEAEAERLVRRMQASAGRGTDAGHAADTNAGRAGTPSAGDASTVVDNAPVGAAAPATPAGDRAPQETMADAGPAAATATATPRARTRATGAAARAGAKAPARPARRTPARPAAAMEVAATEPAATALAIPGYDTLSASQVIPRLDALRPDELEAVRRHEASHRSRRTILSRIAQLQS